MATLSKSEIAELQRRTNDGSLTRQFLNKIQKKRQTISVRESLELEGVSAPTEFQAKDIIRGLERGVEPFTTTGRGVLRDVALPSGVRTSAKRTAQPARISKEAARERELALAANKVREERRKKLVKDEAENIINTEEIEILLQNRQPSKLEQLGNLLKRFFPEQTTEEGPAGQQLFQNLTRPDEEVSAELRDRAIDVLERNGQPITDANIDFVLDQFKQGETE